jgi:CRP/FNR family transcriptional regulator, cyclic AMP receptor protein
MARQMEDALGRSPRTPAVLFGSAATQRIAAPRGAPAQPPSEVWPLRQILSDLSGQCVNRLAASAKPFTFSAQSVLFQKGESAAGCYWVQRGLLKASVLSPDGEERLVALYGPGDIVGELAMIDRLPRFATVAAVTDCQVAFVDAATFQACLQTYPELHHSLVSTLAHRLREAQDDVAASFLPSSARVARALLKLMDLLGEPIDADHIGIPYQIRHDALGMVAGVARESASRVLAGWRRRHIISRTSKHPLIVHKADLQRE